MLPEPPDCPREFSDTPRLKTCGSFWISAVVEAARTVRCPARDTVVTVEPTGTAPRIRLPVTTISSRSPASAGGASCAAAMIVKPPSAAAASAARTARRTAPLLPTLRQRLTVLRVPSTPSTCRAPLIDLVCAGASQSPVTARHGPGAARNQSAPRARVVVNMVCVANYFVLYDLLHELFRRHAADSAAPGRAWFSHRSRPFRTSVDRAGGGE